jgi:hypothetical protein
MISQAIVSEVAEGGFSSCCCPVVYRLVVVKDGAEFRNIGGLWCFTAGTGKKSTHTHYVIGSAGGVGKS